MQIILLEKIKNLGILGDQVNVKSGYARNFLIPKGKAILATKKNIELFESRRSELQIKLIKNLEIANERAREINKLGSITVRAKAGEEGKLFGSIGSKDIARAITMSGIRITKNEIRLSNGILRTTGSHEVKIRFHNEVSTKIVVHIVGE